MEWKILGPLIVEGEHGPIDITGIRRKALLLRLIVSANSSISDDRLIEDLWESDPPSGAASNLASHVSLLRRLVGTERIARRAGGYMLVVNEGELDSARFEEEVSRGQQALDAGEQKAAAQHLVRALGCWRGSALMDAAEMAWARPLAIRLEELRWTCEEMLFETQLALGRHVDLVGTAEAAVGAQPLRERRWAHLMLALYRSGRQSDALRAYQRLRTLLGDELGIEPSAELESLENAIILQKPELDWYPAMGAVDEVWAGDRPKGSPAEHPNSLPHQRSSFVGREKEVAEVTSLLDRGRLVTLTGPGGVGKTRLAVEVGRSVLRSTEDGVWLVELAAISEPELVAAKVLRDLGIEGQSDKGPLSTLVEVLGAQHRLVIVDNCEQVVDGCAVVADTIVRSCPKITMLMTSREPLHIDGEAIYRVPSLSLPPEHIEDLGDLVGSGAVALFVERASTQAPGFALTDTDAPRVAAICRRLDGMPLALELATARLRAMSLTQLEDRLNRRFSLLTGGSRVSLPRQQTLRALVDWSYDLLSEPVKAVFRRTTVFVDGFELEAAERVCAFENIDEGDVANLLSALVDQSMVVAEPHGDTLRYRLLETLHQYGVERLTEPGAVESPATEYRSGEANEAADAHADYYISFAEQAAGHLETRSSWEWMRRLETEDSNLRKAVDHAMRTQAGAELVLHHFWSLRRYWTGARQPGQTLALLEQALERAGPDVAPGLRGKALYCKASLLRLLDVRREREAALTAVDLAREAGDRTLEANALVVYAKSLSESGRGQEALEPGTEAVALARQIGDPVLLGIVLTWYSLALDWSDASRLESIFVELLALVDESGDEYVATSVHNNYALLLMNRGDLADARRHLELALDLTGSETNIRSTTSCINLGWVLLQEGEPHRAASCVSDALRVARLNGFFALVPYLVLVLACCATSLGESERAAILHGGADALLSAAADHWEPDEASIRGDDVAVLQERMGDDFDQHYEKGLTMLPQEIVKLALASG